MKPINCISGKCAKVIAVALLGVATLAGCSSNDDDDYSPPAPTPTPTPTPVLDTFYAAVTALVANSPDDTESGVIDAAVVTTPEDSEPLG